MESINALQRIAERRAPSNGKGDLAKRIASRTEQARIAKRAFAGDDTAATAILIVAAVSITALVTALYVALH